MNTDNTMQPTMSTIIKEARAAYKRHMADDAIVAKAVGFTPAEGIEFPAALKVWQTLIAEDTDPFAANVIALALEPYHKCVMYLAQDAEENPYRHRVAAWTRYEMSSYDGETNTHHCQGDFICPQGEQSTAPSDPLTYVEVTYPVEGAAWWAEYILNAINH